MKEVLYPISGKLVLVVMNIGGRALTCQRVNVHAAHELMSVADCGWGMLLTRNVQEAGDFCLICRRPVEVNRYDSSTLHSNPSPWKRASNSNWCFSSQHITSSIYCSGTVCEIGTEKTTQLAIHVGSIGPR